MSAIPQKAPEANLESAPAAASDKFPPGIPFIVGNEGAERFSFYGMKAILKVYVMALFIKMVMTESDATAKSTSVVHLFVAAVYAFPLIGAIISDRLLGKYRTIFWVSLIYCAGHAVLAVMGRLDSMGLYTGAEWALYVGLALIAIGSGGIKPCVSANVGDQFTAENGHLVTKVFQIFYFIINYGSFVSTIATPFLYKELGPEVAFGVPGILMGLATVLFWMGRNKFVKVPPKPGGTLGLLDTIVTLLLLQPLLVFAFGGALPALADFVWASKEDLAAAAAKDPSMPTTFWSVMFQTKFVIMYAASLALFGLGAYLYTVRQKIQPDSGFLTVLLYAIRNSKNRKPGQGFFDMAREKFGQEAGDGPPAVLRIIVVFSAVTVFWALFDQHASTWIDQAKMMNLVLTVPAMTWRWILGATGVLTVLGGVWLFMWISNTALPNRVVYTVLGLVGVAGVAAGVCDALVPTGDLVDGVRQTMNTIRLEPAQLSALNPVMVMIIIPALNVFVYAPLRKRGIEVKPLQKMVAGMFLASLAFVAAAVLQKAIENAGVGKVHGLWQAVPYVVMTTSEVLVSITGLEFAYTQAPRAMKSTISSFWLLTITFGNLLVAFIAPMQKTFPLSTFFWLFAGLMLVAAFIFAVLSRTYKGKTYLQEAASH